MTISSMNQTPFQDRSTQKRRHQRRKHLHPAKEPHINTLTAIRYRNFRTLFCQFALLTGRTHGRKHALNHQRFMLRAYGQQSSEISSVYGLRRVRSLVACSDSACKYPLVVSARRRLLSSQGKLICIPGDVCHAADVSLGQWLVVNQSGRGALVSKNVLKVLGDEDLV